MNTITGKVWAHPGMIDTNQILPQQYWMQKYGELDLAALGEHAMEGLDATFAEKALAGEYSFIVAGENFGGGGKSMEHPIYALKGVGIKAVIAESVSRYFFRNMINNGVLVLIKHDISSFANTGDEIAISPGDGTIRNITQGTATKFEPMPEFLTKIVESGGYIDYLKKAGS